jgi:hypothetical protein
MNNPTFSTPAKHTSGRQRRRRPWLRIMLNPKPQSSQAITAAEAIAAAPEFARGDWVRVKSLQQIQMTLDVDGTLDGLPMMPEMTKHCGERLRIVRFANQVCANVGTVKMRSLSGVVVLKVDRCDGQFHGGCAMGCDFLWKTQWLTADDANEESTPEGDLRVSTVAGQHNVGHDFQQALIQLSAVDKCDGGNVVKGPKQYFRCQATELGAASRQTSAFNLEQYRVERQSNGTSLGRIGAFLASTVYRKVTRQNTNCGGPCRRTPVSDLGLEIGDKVRVKSFQEIVKTLDAKGCNRGLWFDEEEMLRFCGRELTVTRRINRLIHEGTGELLEMRVPAVVLNETQCSGLSRRFCGRGMLHFWREVWLDRA